MLLSSNGAVPCSSLDHVYTSKIIKDCIKIEKIQNGASDHLPVLAHYSLDLNKIRYKHTVKKEASRTSLRELERESCITGLA